VAQGFFLYGYEPGGNRVEVTTGGYLMYDPDPEPVVWSEDERKLGQAWRVKTVEAFHTYGTPPVDPATGLAESESDAIAAQE
jgi:catechol 2,3-dioxygenase